MNKRVLWMMTLLLCGKMLYAQSVGMEYITELQTDFKGESNFVNYLRLNGELPLSERVKLRASTISAAKSNEACIANDIQGASNIEIDNLSLALFVACVEWDIDAHNNVLFGVHNMNEDFFASDVTGLFTNSSCGIYPTISLNYSIANYPVASVGVRYRHDDERFGFVSALYNGVGYNRFTGRENVFRVCPKSDGVFALAQGEYKHDDSHYFIGGCLHYGDPYEMDERKARTTLWTYAEQKVTNSLTLLGGYSHAFCSDSYCHDFAGLGGRLIIKNAEFGLFSDYAHFEDIDEWATELTCKIHLSEHMYVQPTAHFISQDTKSSVVGILRLGVEL